MAEQPLAIEEISPHLTLITSEEMISVKTICPKISTNSNSAGIIKLTSVECQYEVVSANQVFQISLLGGGAQDFLEMVVDSPSLEPTQQSPYFELTFFDIFSIANLSLIIFLYVYVIFKIIKVKYCTFSL